MASDQEALLKELQSIRKLMVLALLRSGMTQTQVAGALDLDRSMISRMFPKGTLNSLKSSGD